MEFVVIDSKGNEKGFLPESASLDFELGTDNGDLQVTVGHDVIKQGDFIICYGTEYGAVMEESITKTGQDSETWYGHSFRKLLEQIVITPSKGDDYREVSGDANKIISDVLRDQLGGFFHVEQSDSGIHFENYQFPRYCTVYDGLTDMLSGKAAKIHISIKPDPFAVWISAKKAVDYSDQVEFSEDGHAVVTLIKNRRGINHLICLGSGKLKDRQVVDLYVWPDGSVKRQPYWTGFHERTAVYDLSSAENTDEMIKNGTKRLQELASSDSASVSVSGVELDIGDVVSGKSYGTNQVIQAPIVSKIVQIDSDGNESITYKTKGET